MSAKKAIKAIVTSIQRQDLDEALQQSTQLLKTLGEDSPDLPQV